MKKIAVALAAVVAIALPATAFAQIGVSGRAGTMGLGGEVSFGLGSRLALRAGIGALPYEYNGQYSDLDYSVAAPSSIWNVGVDFYPGLFGLRFSGGLLNRPQFDLEGHYTGTVMVGGTPYTGVVDIVGYVENESSIAPYAAFGFGSANGRGLGIFMDLGAAFMSNGNVELSGTYNGQSNAQLDQDVEQEEQQIEDDFGRFLKIHPILQFGLRIGF